MFETQDIARAFSRALANAGKSMAARMAMMAMTTNNSINVNLKACFIVFLLILNLHAWTQKLLIHYI